MSKNTFFNTRFWLDSYIADLDPIEKLLFNYCLTSPALSLCGIYEVPLKFVATETGIDKDMVSKILVRFEQDKKIAYKNGWMCVLNYPKYQSYNLPAVKKGLEKELKSIPPLTFDYFLELGYDYNLIAKALPIDCQSIGNRDRDMVMDKEMEVVPKRKTTSFNYNDFKEFWDNYPKKVGKGAAEKAWQKLKPNLTVVLEAIEAHKQTDQWSKDNGQFIPHPATWLNQKRWEDEVVSNKVETIIL